MTLPALPGHSWIILSAGTASLLAAGALLFGADPEVGAESSESALPVVVRQVPRLDRPGYLALSGDVEAVRSAMSMVGVIFTRLASTVW